MPHLPDTVLEFGPLHEIWEFAFERLLRFLKSAGGKQRAAIGAAMANRMRLHGQIQTLAAVVEAAQPEGPRLLGPPPVAQTRGQALATRAPMAEEQVLLQRCAQSAMPRGYAELQELHAVYAATGGSQESLWDWLASPLGSPSAEDLAPLSREARLIAGGFGAVMQTFALVEVSCRGGWGGLVMSRAGRPRRA